MPQLLPFAGLRYSEAAGPLSDLVCPPYDVINAAQEQQLLARSPYNAVRVELPGGRYREAAELLASWRQHGVLARDPAPALYGYRMTYSSPEGTGRRVGGVIGALVLEAPGAGVLPHEQTTPKAKSDRLELLRAVHANTSPIWCLCPGDGLSEAVPGPGTGQVAAARDEEGALHELWPIYDPRAHAEVAAAAAAGPLLVADGHHRYETAVAFRAETGSNGPEGPGAVMAFVVGLSEGSLDVRAIHRVVAAVARPASGLPGLLADFELTPARSGTVPGLLAEMAAAGALCVLGDGGPLLARAKPGSRAEAFPLDSSRVDDVLARAGATGVAYEHDPGAAAGAVAEGRAELAVLCRPATVAQVAATARGGGLMPPKTTFFWPKPRTGMVLRDW